MSAKVTSPRELLIALGHIQVTPQGKDYEDAVADGARKWLAEFGKRPSADSGDATKYVGFSAKWKGIHSAFYYGSNGVRKLGGLKSFLNEQGIG